MSYLPPDHRTRLLVIAPHPDDEALGCGGLIQSAREAGAAVRVLFVTDGDNNPWPQRVLERRLRITPDRRTAWGRRRRAEALASIRRLGLTDYDAAFGALPDQGLTADLLTGAGRFAALLRLHLGDFAPTLVAGPSIHDTHPDHSAIAAMTRLLVPDIPVLEYAIHGRVPAGEAIELTPAQVAAKRAAILSHRTQTALSARRFLAYARPVERFGGVDDEPAEHPVQFLARDDRGWTVSLRPHPRFGHLAGRYLDLLGIVDGRIATRRRVRIAGRAHVIDLVSGEAVASGCHRHGRLHLPTHALPARVEAVLAKRTLRFGFFDESGWRHLSLVPADRPLPALAAV